jgi:hypothetical protein
MKTPFERNLEAVYADDGEADVRVIFGYDNSADIRHVNDPYRAEHFIDYLKRAGFRPMTADEELRKELGVTEAAENLRVYEALDRHGRRVRLSLIWSARTKSFARNIGSEAGLQTKCSEEALSFMQRAASHSEVMIYVGHSREGGGPDTFPPEVRPSGGEALHRVDFAPYRSRRPGLAALAAHFSKPTPGPRIISWTSCKSDAHFQSWFRKQLSGKAQDTTLVMSTRFTTFHPWIAEIAENDEGLMATVCIIEALRYHPSEKAFEARLRQCEIEADRIPGKPAWRVSTVPGKGRLQDANEGMAVAGP